MPLINNFVETIDLKCRCGFVKICKNQKEFDICKRLHYKIKHKSKPPVCFEITTETRQDFVIGKK